MQKINLQATAIFCRLLKILNGQQHMKLHSDGFMPLIVERIQENIITTFGGGTLYSLCHYYEQNGDLMRDPEMCFIVVDNRKKKNDYAAVGIFPQMYQLDSLGLFEESVTIDNGAITNCIKMWQKGQCSFANIWLKNIREQGFLLASHLVKKPSSKK